jgi:arsenite methyltransferase
VVLAGWCEDAEANKQPDIRIIDSKHDLNVYLTAAQEPETSAGCCEPSSKDKSSGCCGPPSEDEPKGCCGSMASIAKEIAKDIGDMDWNEWVGSFQIYALKPEVE